jgi:hypothetical protein
MANPIITNVGLVSRFAHLALASKVVLDGADISADGFLPRGAVLFKKGNGKWRQALNADTLAADGVRILEDEVKVSAGQDAFGAAYFEGFFKLSSILDANSGAAIVAGNLTAAAGFHLIEADELRLK